MSRVGCLTHWRTFVHPAASDLSWNRLLTGQHGCKAVVTRRFYWVIGRAAEGQSGFGFCLQVFPQVQSPQGFRNLHSVFICPVSLLCVWPETNALRWLHPTSERAPSLIPPIPPSNDLLTQTAQAELQTCIFPDVILSRHLDKRPRQWIISLAHSGSCEWKNVSCVLFIFDPHQRPTFHLAKVQSERTAKLSDDREGKLRGCQLIFDWVWSLTERCSIFGGFDEQMTPSPDRIPSCIVTGFDHKYAFKWTLRHCDIFAGMLSGLCVSRLKAPVAQSQEQGLWSPATCLN